MEIKVREVKNDAHTMERYNDPADGNWIYVETLELQKYKADNSESQNYISDK